MPECVYVTINLLLRHPYGYWLHAENLICRQTHHGVGGELHTKAHGITSIKVRCVNKWHRLNEPHPGETILTCMWCSMLSRNRSHDH